MIMSLSKNIETSPVSLISQFYMLGGSGVI